MTDRLLTLIPVLAVVWPQLGCPVQHLQVRDCTEEELELIDRAIGEAVRVESYVNESLEDDYADVETTYADIIDRLIRVRSRDAIRCGDAVDDPVGAYSEDGKYRSYADPFADTITMSTVRLDWVTSMVEWENGRAYGEIDIEEIPGLVAGMDGSEFDEFRDQAEDYLTAPAVPAYVLVHEAAHIEMDVAHDQEEMYDNSYREFITDIGIYAAYGIVWERWVPESEWLDHLYGSTHE